jgi:hypothetical protein
MHIPISGLVFVPLAGAVYLFRPSRLVELLIYVAVFQGASVLNAGGGFSVGLSPYYLVAALVSFRVTMKWASGKIHFHRGEFAQIHLQLMAVFIGWCVVSAFLLPVLFEGTPVDSPRAGAEAVFYLAFPLKWSFSNAGQAGYMVFNFLVLLALADYAAKHSTRRLIDAFSYSGMIVVAVGLYQMLAFRVGLPFPSSFFNSNAVWGQAFNQMMAGGWHRVSSTFVEPSEAGGFLSCWLLFELVLANWGSTNRRRHWLFALAGCLVLLATASSTGYATVALILAVLAARLAFEIVNRGQIPIRIGLAAAGIVVVGAIFLMRSGGSSLLDSVLLHKAGSSSATYRTATVWRAFDVLQDTYGLGAGLGSNRALSMLAYIGSNLGVFGLALFLFMIGHLYAKGFNLLRGRPWRMNNRVAVIACAAAGAANLIGMTLSGAEISNPRIWVLWGMMLACIRAQTLTADSEALEMYRTASATSSAFYPRSVPN